MILTVLALALATGTTSFDTHIGRADWLLVRGEPDQVLTLSYEAIGNLYLRGAPYEIVDPRVASRNPETGRLVIGTPTNNALVEQLSGELGIAMSDGRLMYAGRKFERGQGLVISTSDPDGDGALVLFTGVDEAGVYSCFTTSINIANTGWFHTAKDVLLASGNLPMRFDTSAPRIVRLDKAIDRLAFEAGSDAGDERALYIGLGLLGYADVLSNVGAGGDLLHFGRWVIGPGRQVRERTELFFGRRDFERATREAHAACARLLGPIEGAQPVYYLVHSYPNATNAKNFGVQELTGRRRIVLNLPALARAQHLDAALIHETIHAHQDVSAETLAERAVLEGVATHLTQLVDPTISDADALFWTEKELASARENHAKILEAFRAVQKTDDAEKMREFTQLGVPLSRIPGAPSRTAYYLGWLAARAWLAVDPQRTPVQLLHAPAKEVLAALR